MTRTRQKGVRWRVYALLSGALVFAAFGAFHLAICIVPLPPELLKPSPGTVTLTDEAGRALASLDSPGARAHTPIPLADMGDWLPKVTVALEDHRFYAHHGIDLHATAGAIIRNLRAGRITSGASTITQQLIKLSSQRTHRSWRAKFYENVAALRLEREWPKERILQEYLNRSHYANRRVGPQAAAEAYFNKAAANLTLPEALYLAGLAQAPTRFNPWRKQDASAAKYRRSLSRLSEIGVLSLTQRASMQQPPHLAERHPSVRNAPHFVDALLAKETALPPGRVQTTLDLELQQFASAELEMHLRQLAHRRVRQGAIVIIDVRTGAIRAMVGSRNYAGAGDGQINGTMIFRSCGSTLKPFLYLNAIEEQLLNAASLLPDTPDAVRAEYIDYDPINYDHRFWGPVRVREALGNSLNVPAVVTLARVGARKTFRQLEQAGLQFARSFTDYGAGLILGNAEVRLLELTAAYTAFAAEGFAAEPRFLADAPVRHRRVAGADATAIISDILSDNEARQKTFGPFSPLAFESVRIPCKTGTSSSFRDAWTIGLTREHAVGVWMGNFNGQPMDELAAVAGPAPLWRTIIQHLLDRGDSGLAEPIQTAGLAPHQICRLTGLKPTSASPDTATEWFLTGTEPAAGADRYIRSATTTNGPRIVLPPEYARWCQGGRNYLGAIAEAPAALRIVNPAPGSVFLFDRNLSAAQQALPLIASGRDSSEAEWRVDGAPVSRSGDRCYWQLSEGEHTVEVITPQERAVAHVSVR